MKSLMFFSTLFLCGILFAQNFPSLEPSPEVYAYAEKLSRTASASYWRDLAETALWASSVNTGNQTGAYLEMITGVVNVLASDPNLPSDTKARGEYLLFYMHKNFLKSYSERQTRLDELLRSGRYNCVSSAVFYMILSLSLGLDADGVMTKDHAFATINTGRELIDVETTNMYGFDPGNRKEFQDSFGKATGFAYVPAKNYRDRTAINPPELVSLILSNRIAELELRNDFYNAVPLSINREALLSKNNRTEHNSFFEDPHKDMMTRLFNYGAWLIKTGKDDDALAWAEYAGKVFPDEKTWQDFIYAAANNRAVRLIRARKIAEARAGLEAVKERLSADNYKTLDGMVLEAELAEQVNGIKNSGDVEAALSRIGSEWERIPEKSREELRSTAVLKEVERLGKTKDWLGAIAWIEAAVGQYGSNRLFENALRTLRQNRAGEIHNGFAALYNKRDYNGAKAFVEKALEEYPGNRQLEEDLKLVEQTLARQ
ncbi:MAG: S49 family peptidase [Treponema sp.]|jgi:tetratricopeptide (TPR) repeat protein|nr:S49 family peptidase [Treponema sp.]